MNLLKLQDPPVAPGLRMVSGKLLNASQMLQPPSEQTAQVCETFRIDF